MELILVKSTWGMEESPVDAVEKIYARGYRGVEAPLASLTDPDAFFRALRDRDMYWIGQVFSEGGVHDVKAHVDSFRRQVEASRQWNPLLLDAHSARDAMTFDEQCQFYQEALEIEQRLGIPIGHETHRSRALHSPWSTAALLRQFPDLHLTADLSHWVVVCESYLADQTQDVALALKHSIHVHGRVGFPEGPQVPHPAAPEWEDALAQHEVWWDQIRQHREAAKAAAFTFDPEFGPPGYMPTLPFTSQPVADLWEVCGWMADRARSRWAS